MLLRIVKPNAEIVESDSLGESNLVHLSDTIIVDTNVLYHILLKNNEEAIKEYIASK